MISELDERFNIESSTIVTEFSQLLPTALYNKSVSEKHTKAKFSKVLRLYEDDLPSSGSLDIELDLWEAKWEHCESNLAYSCKSLTSPHADQDYFPNIHTLMLIMVTLPITSCECEHSISLLQLVKSTLHTTMREDRLNGLALMQYYHDIQLNPDEIVAEFAQCHPRRMEL